MFLPFLLVGLAWADDPQPVEPSEALSPEDEALLRELEAELAEAPPPVVRTPTPGAGLPYLDLAFIADVALAAFTTDDPLQTGAHDPQVNGFNLQQLELSLGASVDPYFRLDGNIVFGEFGVEIEEIYATTLALPARTQLRVGQFLTRFGRANPTHPHTWAFVDQPFLVGRVLGAEGNRGVGVEGSVLLPLPWSVEIFASETMAGGEATARSFYGANDLGVDGPLDLQTTVGIEQFWALSPEWSLLWGLSWAGGPNPTGRQNRTELYGTDLFLKFRPLGPAPTELSLQGELVHRRYQVPGDVLTDLTAYAWATWRFHRRWSLGARYELGTPTRNTDGLVVPHPVDPTWLDDRHRVAANLTFWPTEFSRLRLQAQHDRPEWRDEGYFAAFLAFEFSVGAHGAHPF